MEKIYMEENKNKRQKKSVIDSSVILSFVVSIVAVFSLAMFGIISNQDTDVSYAVDPEAQESTLTVNEEKDSANNKLFIFGLGSYQNPQDETIYTELHAFRYLAGGKQAYCLEYKNDAVDGEYQSEDKVAEGQRINLPEADKKAVSYIIDKKLNITMPAGQENNKKYVETWIKQVAIWLYLNDNVDNPNMKLETVSPQVSKRNDAIYANQIKLGNSASYSSAETIYTGNVGKQVEDLAQEAKGKAASTSTISLTLNKDGDDFTVVKDDNGNVKYYQSSLINVVASSNLNSYKINIEEEGVEAYDEDGNKLELNKSITSPQKFYVRIPGEKVKYPDSFKVDIKVDGSFETDIPTVIQAIVNPTLRQRLMYFQPETKSLQKGVEVVVTPDTGVNATQAIYFIGLIVLLCGVGIVYANAKPVQSKQ